MNYGLFTDMERMLFTEYTALKDKKYRAWLSKMSLFMSCRNTLYCISTASAIVPPRRALFDIILYGRLVWVSDNFVRPSNKILRFLYVHLLMSETSRTMDYGSFGIQLRHGSGSHVFLPISKEGPTSQICGMWIGGEKTINDEEVMRHLTCAPPTIFDDPLEKLRRYFVFKDFQAPKVIYCLPGDMRTCRMDELRLRRNSLCVVGEMHCYAHAVSNLSRELFSAYLYPVDGRQQLSAGKAKLTLHIQSLGYSVNTEIPFPYMEDRPVPRRYFSMDYIGLHSMIGIELVEQPHCPAGVPTPATAPDGACLCTSGLPREMLRFLPKNRPILRVKLNPPGYISCPMPANTKIFNVVLLNEDRVIEERDRRQRELRQRYDDFDVEEWNRQMWANT